MLLTEYDEIKAMKLLKAEGREEGRTEERKDNISKKLRKGFTAEQIHEDDEYPMELIREVEKELSVSS